MVIDRRWIADFLEDFGTLPPDCTVTIAGSGAAITELINFALAGWDAANPPQNPCKSPTFEEQTGGHPLDCP